MFKTALLATLGRTEVTCEESGSRAGIIDSTCLFSLAYPFRS